MNIRKLKENEKKTYNDFIAAFPSGHIFQSFEWGEVKASLGWKPHRFIIEDGNKIVGAYSLLERKYPLINKTLLYIPCGPAFDLGDKRLISLFAEKVEEFAKAQKAAFLKIDPPIDENNQLIKDNLAEAGFKKIAEDGSFEGIQPRCVMQLDIHDDLDDVLMRMNHKWRYNIRLAERKGVGIRKGDSKEDLEKFYAILKITGKRDNFLIRDISYFNKIFDVMASKDMVRLFMAEYKEKALASTIAFKFGDKCWYVYGASGNEYRNLMPNHALQWAMIQWAKDNGCPVYDFRGIPCDLSTSHPLHGLVKFKKGFGAKPVKYIGEHEIKFSKVFSLIYKRGMPVYTNLRKAVRR